MKICIVRHGETDWNKKGLRQGRKDVLLNDQGKEQAGKLASLIGEDKWDLIISSPLIRAQETAFIISKKNKIDEILIDEKLTERSYGRFEGHSYTEEIAADKYDDVEKEEEVELRMKTALNNILEQQYPRNVIIVTHGAAIKSLLKSFGEEVVNHIKNGSVTMLNFDGEKISFVYANKTE